MRNFVISLKENNEKRKNHIRDEFSKQNIPFEFFDAITPTQNNDILSEHNLSISHPLTQNEIACSLSHFMIWKQIIDEDIPYAAIFEDDIYLGNNANLFLNSIAWIDDSYDIIKLEKGWQPTIETPMLSSKTVENRQIYKLLSNHYGTAGYILFNKGARFLINYYSNTHVTRTIDSLVFGILISNTNINVQQVLPTICVQDFILFDGHKNFPSAIAIMPDLKPDQKIKYPIPYKIKRETKRTLNGILKAASLLFKKLRLLITLSCERYVEFK